jgi:ribonuclease E
VAIVEETPAPVLAEPVAQTAVVVAEPIPLPVAVPAPPPVVEPVPQVVAVPPQPVAPVVDPIIVPPTPKPAPVDLTGSLQQAGLELVETSHSAPPADSFAPVQPLGRKPKPVPVIANEPLQMVETKND